MTDQKNRRISAVGLWLATLGVMGSLGAQTPPALPELLDGGASLPYSPPLVISVDTTIDLRNAIVGNWTDPDLNGTGIYDPNLRVIVFKPESFAIDPGVTVDFQNHKTRSPVAFLVQGDFVIGDGAVLDLNGEDQANVVLFNPEPGPGGYPGAAYEAGRTIGPGDGGGWADSTHISCSGIPLVGGTGGHAGGTNWSGSGGGGAVLIVTGGQCVLDGSIVANAGWRMANQTGASGSGGLIRLVASDLQIGPNHKLEVGAQIFNGNAGTSNTVHLGVVRIELASVASFNATLNVTPGARFSLCAPNTYIGSQGTDLLRLWPEPQVRVVEISTDGVDWVDVAAATPDPSVGVTGRLNTPDLIRSASPDLWVRVAVTNPPSLPFSVRVRATPRAGYGDNCWNHTVTTLTETPVGSGIYEGVVTSSDCYGWSDFLHALTLIAWVELD